jgi:WD40 repeat protein
MFFFLSWQGDSTNIAVIYYNDQCISNLRHRSPVSAVAMSHEMVITGCEDGIVKVWDLKTAELIKVSQ